MGLEKQFIPPINKGSMGVRETVHTTPKTRRVWGLEKQFIPPLNKGSIGVRETVHTTPKQGEYRG